MYWIHLYLFPELRNVSFLCSVNTRMSETPTHPVLSCNFIFQPDWSRQGQAQEFGIWFMDFWLRMTYGKLDHSLSQRLFKNISLTHWTLGLIHVLSLATQTLKTFLDNVSLELGGLPHVLSLAVHLEWLWTPSWHSGVLRSSIWTM